MVMLHGFGVDHRIVLPLDDALSGRGWRRLYVDLPWAPGWTGPQTGGAQSIAEALVEGIADRLGDEPFAVLGNSFGAQLARYIAHVSEPRALGLATLVGVFEPRHESRRLPTPRPLMRDDALVERAGAAGEAFREIAVIETPETLAAQLRWVEPGLRDADQAVMDAVAADYALDAEPEDARPAPFTRPSVHVFGRQDHVTGYEDGWARRDHYPRGTFAVLDAAGHHAHLERPTLVAALLQDWLDRMDADQPR